LRAQDQVRKTITVYVDQRAGRETLLQGEYLTWNAARLLSEGSVGISHEEVGPYVAERRHVGEVDVQFSVAVDVSHAGCVREGWRLG
jgi:hypothetical protein